MPWREWMPRQLLGLDMTSRDKAFWVIWLIVVISVLWWLAQVASGAHYRTIHKQLVQSPKGAEEFVPMRAAVLSPSPIIIPPRKPCTNVYHFVATAYSADLESDFSNEVSFTNLLRSEFVELSWDASQSPSSIGYRVHWGRFSGQYTNATDAGMNLTLSVRIMPPILSNIVITVACENGGTNIAYASSVRGAWINLNTTNWIATNPTAPRYFRGIGKIGNRVVISDRRF